MSAEGGGRLVAREREWTLSWSNRALGRGPPDLWAGEGRTFGTDPGGCRRKFT